MYEKICRTCQPPLYNFLMFFWLLLFDSEFGFRLAGIITTFVGALGIFKAIDEQSDDGIWANVGTALYIFTYMVAYYGLECAEYNLMLCCMAWTVFFYIRTIRRMNMFSLAGFFIFACLSVYSQYGAVFIVIGMFVTIITDIIKSQNRQLLKQSIIFTLITGVVIVLPLVIFFTIPPMKAQGSVSVSHYPVFKYNFLVDYVGGIFYSLYWIFSGAFVSILSILILTVVCVAILFTVISMIKKEYLRHFAFTFFIAWTIYFVAVACSFYGYNNWDGARGCNNLGGKYTLFFAPITVVILVNGTKYALEYFREKSRHIWRVLLLLSVIGIIAFCGIEVRILNKGWVKDDIREVVIAWYENEAYNSETFIHHWDDTMFQFYLRHERNYDEIYQDGIETAEYWIREADLAIMKEKLSELGYLDKEDYFYVTPINSSYDLFLEITKENGFQVESVYEGQSALLHITK